MSKETLPPSEITLDRRWNGIIADPNHPNHVSNSGSALKRFNGMCCLGVYLHQALEQPVDQLSGVAFPSSYPYGGEKIEAFQAACSQRVTRKELEELIGAEIVHHLAIHLPTSNQLEQWIAAINDSRLLLTEKHKALRAVFSKYLNCDLRLNKEDIDTSA